MYFAQKVALARVTTLTTVSINACPAQAVEVARADIDGFVNSPISALRFIY
jgi:hypothetical protein